MSWFKRTNSFASARRHSPSNLRQDEAITLENELLFQGFEWHTPSEPPPPNETHASRSHWSRLTRVLPSLAELGVSALWLPPGCKANNPNGNGYDCYDLWDLGEFDQKWARSTKWGSREELRDLLEAAAQWGGIEMIWDAVLNHKTAGDATEEAWAVEVDGEDRRVEICPPRKIEAWLKYDFSGRERENMKYSTLKWRAEHFNGTDWDEVSRKNAIYKLIDDPATAPKPTPLQPSPTSPPLSPTRRFSRISSPLPLFSRQKSLPPPRPGKGWAPDVDRTFGNYDYLMFSNIDHTHPAVRADLLAWGEWMISAIGIHGFRLDAAQHFSSTFTREWLARVHAVSERARARPPLVIGEVWAAENSRQIRWLDAVDPALGSAASSPITGSRSRVYAFDAPLLYNFSRLSEAILAREKGDRRAKADLRTLLSGPGNPEHRPLVTLRPTQAVTFVTSHDTQPGQTCAVPMDSGLKALFYAFVLLRREGLPCVFWGDLYGTKGPEAEGPACRVPMGRHESAGGSKKEEEKRSLLPSLMLARKLFAYGTQEDYMDAMECVGWTRAGTRDREGCVVVLSIVSGSRWASKRMRAGKPGEKWVNALDQESDRTEVFIDKRGFGIFTCKGTGVSIYVRQQGKALGRFPVTYNHDAFVED